MMTESKRKEKETAEQSKKPHVKSHRVLHAFIAVLIVVVGVNVAAFFIKNKKRPQRMEQDVLAPLVKVEQVHVRDIPMVVHGYGTVNPTVEVEIIPEVAGKVVSIHPELKVGGLIRSNEKILQIDPRDYELAVRQAEATVADATVLLETEQAEAQVAQKEWSDLHPDTEPVSSLVLREPQIRKAQATLDSAKAQLATAELRLERTGISLPFDILITSESVDLGQYVVTGQSLANAYGTEAVEIQVPLEDDELAWFGVFGGSKFTNMDSETAEKVHATVIADFAGTRQSWDGTVVRTAGQVDRDSRMLSVIVEVTDPFNLSNGRSPLLPGIFADVMIQGKTLYNAVALPRDSIREGNKIWLVNDSRLHIQPLDIVRADKDFAYVVSDIPDKANVVISSLDVATDDMKVRTEFDVTGDGEQEKQDNSLSSGPEDK